MPGIRPDLRETFDNDHGTAKISVYETPVEAYAARMTVHLEPTDGPDERWTLRLTDDGGIEVQSTTAIDDAAVEPDLPGWLATGLQSRTDLEVTV